MHRLTHLLFAVVVGAILWMTIAVTWRTVPTEDRSTAAAEWVADLGVAHATDTAKNGSRPSLHEVTVRRPSGPPRVELAGVDPQGRSASVACSTCHSVRQPNREQGTSAALQEFHQGLQVNHGSLACYACHNPENVDTLRLAGGSTVEYRDVMTLCSQCHAAQATSFAHGAHGGMNGFWDLSRGPQTKNNCIDCHDPHRPTYPKMIVGFKPRDRFLEAEASHDDH